MPSEEYSNQTDYKFRIGPINVMTYLTSRAYDSESQSGGSSAVRGNELMRTDAEMYESFYVILEGAWSGLSAVGFALTATLALLGF